MGFDLITDSMRAFYMHWIRPAVDLRKMVALMRRYPGYLRQWKQYSQLPGAEPIRFGNSYPCVLDKTAVTSVSNDYVHQAIWATERIVSDDAPYHVDIGSQAIFVGLLTTHKPVLSVDIRPLTVSLPNLTCISGDLLHLPFASDSIRSLSCLHVVEHVGLGRYGDALNPDGTRLACRELARVLAPGGNLFFSAPVGKPRVCFNAHRIHSPPQLLEYFQGIHLAEFSGVDDEGELRVDVHPDSLADADCACGFFWFRN